MARPKLTWARLKPYWNNHAFLDIERLPAHERAEWLRGCTQLVARAVYSSTDPDACTATCGPYTAVATLLGSEYVVVTTSRTAVALTSDANGLREDPDVALPIVAPSIFREFILHAMNCRFA